MDMHGYITKYLPKLQNSPFLGVRKFCEAFIVSSIIL